MQSFLFPQALHSREAAPFPMLSEPGLQKLEHFELCKPIHPIDLSFMQTIVYKATNIQW